MEEYMVFRKDFADKLKKMRLSYGLTQEEFAEKINVSHATYVKVERNQRAPSVFFLRNLQKYTDRPSLFFLLDDCNELEKVWTYVKNLPEVDQVIIIQRLARRFGMPKCRELIGETEERKN